MDAASHAPAGWYPVPGGGQRYWNGREWTPDVLGAPSKDAEFAALSPTLPPPVAPATAAPAHPGYPVAPAAGYAAAPSGPAYGAPTAAPGWYPNASGVMQWWDGRAWAPMGGAMPLVGRPPKDMAIAYVLLIFLGGFGAHRFYLGRTGTAVAMLAMTLGGLVLSIAFIGLFALIAVMVWAIVDLFLVPSMVREANGYR